MAFNNWYYCVFCFLNKGVRKMDKKDLTLKAWRIESGLTRVEVAALIGKTEKTIQKNN